MSIAVRPPAPTADARILAWDEGEVRERLDTLAVEEPLEIRLAGLSVAVTMRTPGNDLDLAAGFLFTEGIIRDAADIAGIAHCPADDSESEGNIVNVTPADPAIVDPTKWQRNFFATSSCGVCGKASIAAIRQEAPPIDSDLRVRSEMLLSMEQSLRHMQEVFIKTGGLHAAALFNRQGRVATLQEDIGRHNAVDKVIGAAFRAGSLPLREGVLVVSSRGSFEITQKALMAGIPIVAAVSAPSSLAVELARSSGMTLVGFLRPGRFNIYTGAERIVG